MKKMQCPSLKIVGFLFTLFLLSNTPTLSQISSYRLQQADSLFNAKQYTQSLDHYQKIFLQNQFSPAMLMKMAFIEEGLNRIGQAMYYLNLYYLHTSDESALQKMQQLSEKFKLQGYDNPEAEYALRYYRQYTFYISVGLAALIFFFFSLIVYLRRRRRKPIAAFIVMLIFCVVFVAHLNSSLFDRKAIVSVGNTYVMEGPSGAAPVMEVIAPGHRVSIMHQNDVWVQIQWKDKRGYIRHDRLLPILL